MLMQKEILLENKKVINIIAISGVVLLLILLFFNVKCIFKEIFNIPCISCGLTRGFKSILKLDFINATKYNILSIPLFVLSILFYILYIFSLILKKVYIYKLYNILVKNYKILLIILLNSWLINLLICF